MIHVKCLAPHLDRSSAHKKMVIVFPFFPKKYSLSIY